MPAAGDRVVLYYGLPVEDEWALVQRNVPFNVPGSVVAVDEGNCALVHFDNDRQAFVKGEHLTVTYSLADRVRQRDARKQRSQLQHEAAHAVGFVTPETVDQAFSFGRKGARAGHPRLKRREFLATCDHPFPDSLFTAYVRGWKEGKKQRQRATEAAAAAPDKLQLPQRERPDEGEKGVH